LRTSLLADVLIRRNYLQSNLVFIWSIPSPEEVYGHGKHSAHIFTGFDFHSISGRLLNANRANA
jgi:hypothetical protein